MPHVIRTLFITVFPLPPTATVTSSPISLPEPVCTLVVVACCQCHSGTTSGGAMLSGVLESPTKDTTINVNDGTALLIPGTDISN